MVRKKIIYIAHPISGDVDLNVGLVLGIVKCLNMTRNDIVPFAPYLVDVLAMNDNIPEERSRGFENNKAIFESGCIDEVWLFGDRISQGMVQEVEWANSLGIKVVDKTQRND